MRVCSRKHEDTADSLYSSIKKQRHKKQWHANSGNLKLRCEIDVGKRMELEY